MERISSGAMYSVVPHLVYVRSPSAITKRDKRCTCRRRGQREAEGSAADSRVSLQVKPKSASMQYPSAPMRMFSGLMSRWMYETPWADFGLPGGQRGSRVSATERRSSRIHQILLDPIARRRCEAALAGQGAQGTDRRSAPAAPRAAGRCAGSAGPV